MQIALLVASGCVAFLMAWAIGAQDVSNALGTSVGSKAITVRQAIYIAAVCEFLGSLAGGEVAGMISGGILNVDMFREMGQPGVELYTMCMFSTMCGAFLWLAVATYLSLPVSTTHSLVGSLIGVGVLSAGTEVREGAGGAGGVGGSTRGVWGMAKGGVCEGALGWGHELRGGSLFCPRFVPQPSWYASTPPIQPTCAPHQCPSTHADPSHPPPSLHLPPRLIYTTHSPRPHLTYTHFHSPTPTHPPTHPHHKGDQHSERGQDHQFVGDEPSSRRCLCVLCLLGDLPTGPHAAQLNHGEPM
jgi:hypothetical protein